MKTVWLIIVLILSTSVYATDYYFSTSGSDTGAGTELDPYKTITKANSVCGGDNCYFKRGDVWRMFGDADLNIQPSANYSAYGTGEKPLFIASLNLSNTGNWTDGGASNIWNSTAVINHDVGNLIVNNDQRASGTKEATRGALNSQGEFYYNDTADKLMVYSVGNPASVYTTIEAASTNSDADSAMAFSNGDDSWNMYNLSFKYGCKYAIATTNNANNVLIANNDALWIGGCYQPGSGTLRYGNAYQLGLGSRNVSIINNTAAYVRDACYSTQSWILAGATVIINHVYAYNLGVHCSYGFEYFSSYATSTVTNMSVHHNTFAHLYAIPGLGSVPGRIRLDRTPVNTTGWNFSDNIVYNASYRVIDFADAQDWYAGITFDHNLLYDSDGSFFIQWNGTDYSSNADFVAATGKNSNGAQADPLLNVLTFKPAYNSPACNLADDGGVVGAFACEVLVNLGPKAVYIRNAIIRLAAGKTYLF